MPSSSDSPALIRRALVSEGRHPSVQRSESGNDGGDASFPSTVANSFLVYACSIWDLCASSDVTSQVALDDFVGFLHESAPSSWPRNAETSRPTVFWRDGDWRCESSLARAETGTASTLYNEAQAVPCPSGNRNGLDSLQRGSGAHRGNGRDPAVDQEVCPDDVRRIVRREVNCQLLDFQRIGHPLAWIVGSEDILNRLALLFAWKATEHRRVRRAWA